MLFQGNAKIKASFSQLNKHQEKYFPWKMAIFHSIEITKLFKQGQNVRIGAEHKSKKRNRITKEKQ